MAILINRNLIKRIVLLFDKQREEKFYDYLTQKTL
jgi:hypothetical protein